MELASLKSDSPSSTAINSGPTPAVFRTTTAVSVVMRDVMLTFGPAKYQDRLVLCNSMALLRLAPECRIAETATASVEATMDENSAACCQRHPRSCAMKAQNRMCGQMYDCEAGMTRRIAGKPQEFAYHKAEDVEHDRRHYDYAPNDHQKCKREHLQHDLHGSPATCCEHALHGIICTAQPSKQSHWADWGIQGTFWKMNHSMRTALSSSSGGRKM